MYFMILLFLFIDLFYQYFLFVILNMYRTISQYGIGGFSDESFDT